MLEMIDQLVADMNVYMKDLIAFLPRFGLGLVIFFIGLFLSVRLSSFFVKKLSLRVHDALLVNFLKNFIRWTFIIIVLAFTLHVMGLSGIAGSLVAGAGITAFVIGFAFKDIGENFLSGIILAFKRPFKIGDTIKSDDVTGQVLTLNLRTTHVKTLEGTDVYIPNSIILNNALHNYTKGGRIRNSFTIKISQDKSFKDAADAIIKALKETPEVSKEKEPTVTIEEMGDSGLTLKAYYSVNISEHQDKLMYVRGIAQDNVRRALAAEGFLAK